MIPGTHQARVRAITGTAMSKRPPSPQAPISLIPLREVLLYAPVFHRGQLNLDLYAPRNRDYQQAHDHDELYCIVEGSGWFSNGARRHRFEAGDCLFVPAGVQHRFESFDDQLRTWVMFWGPGGGEAEPPWPEQADPGYHWHWPGEAPADGSTPLFRHGSLALRRLGAADPVAVDRDAVYFFRRGRACLQHAEGEIDANAGDAVFVAAGTEHSLAGDTDLSVWQAGFASGPLAG